VLEMETSAFCSVCERGAACFFRFFALGARLMPSALRKQMEASGDKKECLASWGYFLLTETLFGQCGCWKIEFKTHSCQDSRWQQSMRI